MEMNDLVLVLVLVPGVVMPIVGPEIAALDFAMSASVATPVAVLGSNWKDYVDDAMRQCVDIEKGRILYHIEEEWTCRTTNTRDIPEQLGGQRGCTTGGWNGRY
jgi:hypothetical protein